MFDRRLKITRLAKSLRWAALSCLVILPLLNAGYWVSNGYPFLPECFFNSVPIALGDVPVKPIAEMAAEVKLLGFLIQLIPAIFSMAALYYLAQLFRLYEDHCFFTEQNVRCFRKIGIVLLAGQLAHPFYFAMLSLALTFQNAPGQRNISVALGSDQIAMTLLACVVILISWIMDEGRKLEEEQAATV